MKTLVRWLSVCLVIAFSPGAINADTVSYNYDSAGRLTSVGLGAGRSITYTYDTAGNITRKSFAIITDSDNDGMEDVWESTYFQSLARDGTGDFDSDGRSDLAEFLAGTSPNNAGSLLRILTPIVLDLSSELITISWTSVPGKIYRLQYTLSLNDPQWTDLPGDVEASPGTISAADWPLPVGNATFYRVIVLP